jgi:hypothetical protein
LNDPNATGIAVIVRDVYHSHPSIIFSDPVDFLFSIDFEEQSFRDFFPRGVKAGYLDENSGVWSWYLFEPLQDRFQFDSQATLDLLAFANPISTSSFTVYPEDFIGPLLPGDVRISYPTEQLDKKFKHAPDFGIVTPNKNPTTLDQFKDKLNEHFNDPDTVDQGTYPRVPDSKVFYNPNSHLVIIVGPDGGFVSGWKLVPGSQQHDKLINDGVLR